MLHMLSCLAIDGRFGLTAIGRTPEQAADLYERTGHAVHRHARNLCISDEGRKSDRVNHEQSGCTSRG